MNHLKVFLGVITVILTVGCTRTASRTGPLAPYPEVTSDIQIGETVSGEGTRASLLGVIRWGDPGRASFQAHEQESDLGGKTVEQSMQAAVYTALDGDPGKVIVDPQFHVVEHDFLFFKTATTKVVGKSGQHTNYRQVKRFNTDDTKTLRLSESPQSYTVNRDGKESTKIVTSGNITPYVTSSANVFDVSSGVSSLKLNSGQRTGGSSSLGAGKDDFESKLDDIKRKLDALDASLNRRN